MREVKIPLPSPVLVAVHVQPADETGQVCQWNAGPDIGIFPICGGTGEIGADIPTKYLS